MARMKSLQAVQELCTGCAICEMVCSLGHTGGVNPDRARLRVAETEDERRHPIICRHCAEPRCSEACPVPGADLCGGDPLCAKYCFPRPADLFPHLSSSDQSCLRYEAGATDP
jgi:Fe-S-cluster-containing hydrogenase component 2